MNTFSNISVKVCFLIFFSIFILNPQSAITVTNDTLDVTEASLEKMPVITVFGKILDQDRYPVPETDVEVSWHTLRIGIGLKDDVKSSWIKTDKDGCFKWIVTNGFQPVIRRIQKQGYECLRRESPYFDPMTGGNLMIGDTSQDKPLMFYLRKRGETTFLLKKERVRIDMKSGDADAKTSDLLPEPDQSELDMRPKGNNYQVRHILFAATAEYLTNGPAYKINFIAPEHGGILAGDKIFYEAPADGYQTQTSVIYLSEKHGKRTFFPDKTTWLIIKTADPEIYARLKIDVKLSWENPVIYIESAINPYGDRSFEEIADLNPDVRMKLEMEARSNLREGKRPARPDIPELIKALNEKLEREKARN